MSGIGVLHRFASNALSSKLSRASLLLVAGVFVLLFVGGIVSKVFESPLTSAAATSVGELVSGDDFASFPDGLWRSVLANESNEIPELFDSELLDLSGKEAWASAEGNVLGFWFSAVPEKAMDSISDELAGKGWTKVDSGVPCIASFVKDQGVYRWCYVVCRGEAESSFVSIMLR